MAEQREYKRKKSQKKAQRLKQLEEERESEKNKWLDFNAKVGFTAAIVYPSFAACSVIGHLFLATQTFIVFFVIKIYSSFV